MQRRAAVTAACAILAAVVTGALAQDSPFKDVDRSKMHWAYDALDDLSMRKILLGYPDGYFRGKRTMSRYEFGTALDRLYRSWSMMPGPRGEPGPMGPMGPRGETGLAGEMGPAGMTPMEVYELRRLTTEFRTELEGMGNNMRAINGRLDGLDRAVGDIRSQLRGMPHFYGGFFTGFRSDRADGGYVDYSGRPLTSAGPGSLVNTPVVVNDLAVGFRTDIAGGAKLDAMISANNYKNFLGGNIGQYAPYNLNPDTDIYIHHAYIKTPFTGFGQKGQLTIGRFGERLGSFVLSRPNVDQYLHDPFLDGGMRWGEGLRYGDRDSTRHDSGRGSGEDKEGHSDNHDGHDGLGGFGGYGMWGDSHRGGNYYIDGFKLDFNLGKVRTDIFAGQTKSVVGNNGQPWNSPRAGVTSSPSLGTQIFNFGMKPTDQPFLGQFNVDQMAGIDFRLPFNLIERRGDIRFGGLALTGENGSLSGGPTNAFVPWMRFDYELCLHSCFYGQWAKTITGRGRFDTLNPYDNNAWETGLRYRSGPFHVNAGYRYIDPLFFAPGYWGRIGNWTDPTNVQGPNFQFGYNATPSLGVHLGGDFLSPARNRANVGSLGGDDEINRIRAGFRWNLSKSVHTSFDWEGVYWKLSGAHSGIPALGTGTIHPTEHYYTFTTGYNLTSNTQLKLLYQIGDYDGHGALNGGAGVKYNFNVFSTQVAVHF